ncbi:MAG: DUF3592 domain-containing protein [Chitinivibrionales bacterium]|nr:DUF3592 domain-containing protein [Chitinivibrionales bacterium]
MTMHVSPQVGGLVVFALFGTPLLLWLAIAHFIRVRRYDKTTGVITREFLRRSRDSESGRTRTTYAYECRFTDKYGYERSSADKLSSSRRREIGSEVPIWYDPHYPRRMKIGSVLRFYLVPSIFLAFMTLMALAIAAQ